MARPTPQKVLGKAPARPHPAAPLLEEGSPTAPLWEDQESAGLAAVVEVQAPTVTAPAAAPTGEALQMFSVRIGANLRRRAKLYAVESGHSLQEVTEAALREYLDHQQGRHLAD